MDFRVDAAIARQAKCEVVSALVATSVTDSTMRAMERSGMTPSVGSNVRLFGCAPLVLDEPLATIPTDTLGYARWTSRVLCRQMGWREVGVRAFAKEGAAKGLTTRQSASDRTKPHRFGWTATQAFFVPAKGAFFEYHKGVLLVIELRQEEINQVGGGMKWCYGEMSDNVIVDGSVSEDTMMQWAVGGGCGGLRDNIPHLDFVC